MARPKITPETRRALKEAQAMVQACMKQDGNEAETRRRVERIFEQLLGYDALTHLSRERAIKGAGETEHVDFALHLEREGAPVMLIELKRVAIDLAPKHLKQVTSYAIDAGCNWVLLTNGRQWQVHHIEFGQPPITTLLEQWHLLDDDLPVLASRFDLLSFKNVRRGLLDERWQRARVLAPKNLLAALLSEDSLRMIKRCLRKSAGVLVDYRDIVSSVTKLLNEHALNEMEGLRVRVPQRKLVRAPAVDGATARADDALDDEVPLAASESAGESSDELS